MTMISASRTFRYATPARQRGIILVIVLIALILLSLAGAAMMRASDTSGVVIGNIGFREGAVTVSDLGIEDARTWLAAQWSSMNANAAGRCTPGASAGNPTWCLWYDQTTAPTAAWYRASTADNFDPRTYAWTGTTAKAVTAGVPAGYSIQWVIHRMCENGAGGDPGTAGTLCLKQSGVAAAGESQLTGAYGKYMKKSYNSGPYYRVTVRVVGPRATTAYVQALVY
jgi:Tfp pilus assembly protein PilX